VSVYLEAVAQTAERRQHSETEFRAALARAAEHHSLQQIANAAGMSKSGVVHLVNQQKETKEDDAA
jgi:biotin operon repressor